MSSPRPNVSLIVPFTATDPERVRNWAWCRDRLRRVYPDWEIVVGVAEGQPWRKGVAVNKAVSKARGGVLVVIDADVVLAPEALREAVAALSEASWVIPHRLVYRLSEKSTQAFFDGRLMLSQMRRQHLARRPFRGPIGGGASVMRREDFVGIDERFTDWGGEDLSFARAMDTLVGPHFRLAHTLWHLYHRPMDRRPGNRASAENETLANAYLDADGDPVAMAKLCEGVNGGPYEGVMGGGAVVASAEAMRSVPLDERFGGWGQEDESWAIALECVLGPCRRLDHDLVHLYHPPLRPASGRYGSQASKALRCRYKFARNKPDVMRDLLEEARCLSPS